MCPEGSGEGDGVTEGVGEGLSEPDSRIPTSPEAVGVLGGSVLLSERALSGMTGPGIELISGVVESSAALRLEMCGMCGGPKSLNVREGTSRILRFDGVTEPEFLALCSCGLSFAVYSVSTPSGIITTNAVPTRTPMPIVDIRRSRDWEREKDRGKDPARKDLELGLVVALPGY